jgi:hypothetical protein
VRNSDAFEPSGDDGRDPPGAGRRQILDQEEVQGNCRAQAEDQSDWVPIEKKESIRWLENMKQATELLAEPGRCVHIGDRESDIFELFCTAHELGTHFLVRTCVDCLAGHGDHTIADEMDEVEIAASSRSSIATACDRLASGEDDPFRVAEGVPLDAVDAPSALSACDDAVRDRPGEPRYLYLRGRAHSRAARIAEDGNDAPYKNDIVNGDSKGSGFLRLVSRLLPKPSLPSPSARPSATVYSAPPIAPHRPG